MSDDRASLMATLSSTGQSEGDLGTVGQTIRRPLRAATQPELPRLSLSGQGGVTANADFIPGEELGRGGMGVVQLAQQHSLGREVAIKTARSTDEAVRQALVREARIMGSLEHPNVVPVHSLGVDADGAPILVMKRVEGTSWRTLLDQPAHPNWAPLLLGHEDKLRAHVEILTQVCRALSFAHDRGVVHRDLKPDNVMIGRFGEVYLLDWGIALKLSERDDEPRAIVGTPGYLAPEMARGDAKGIDTRADVYLLGSTLFEILSGHAPHEAPTVTAALISSVSGILPPLPASAPSELASLVRAAMEAKVEARLGSAELFREGLSKFLVSRQAEVLAADARAALKHAEQLIAQHGAASADAFRALVEARFGFASAHRMRPQDESLLKEQESVINRLVERELAVRSPSAARALLADLRQPAPELLRRIDAMTVEVEAERGAAGELAKSRRAADTSGSVRQLVWVVSPVGVIGLAVGFWFFGTQDMAHYDPGTATLADTGMLALVWALVFGFRRRLFATDGSARVTIAGTIWASGVVIADMVGALSHGTIQQCAVGAMTAGLIGAAMVTGLVLRDMWPSVPVQLTVIGVILAIPGWAPWAGAAASVINLGLFVRAAKQLGDRTRAANPAP